MVRGRPVVDVGTISSMRCAEGNTRMVESDLDACKDDVCLSFSLSSHLLHRRFLGLRNIEQIRKTSTEPLVRNYEQAFKVVETELAFLYDILYTSNTFLHYYEAKSAIIWAFASVVGICFAGTVAVVPGARTTRRASPGTVFVDTTIADFVITRVIPVSLALLHVLQLIHCWTSNWARVAFACDYARRKAVRLSCGMRLKACLLKFNLYDKYPLWQNKLGQYSVIGKSIRNGYCGRLLAFCCRPLFGCVLLCCCYCNYDLTCCLVALETTCLNVQRCLGLLGLQYISRELKEMFRGCGSGGTGSLSPLDLQLHPEVKTSIGDFIRDKIRSDEVSDWASSDLET